MHQSTFHVLDKESIQDPEALLCLVQDLLHTQKVLTRALAMTTCLVLYQVDALEAPSEQIFLETVDCLKEYLAAVEEDTKLQAEANQYIDLLEARE